MSPVAAIAPARPLRVLALAKQIPVFEDMQLGADGRLVRDGLDLHMNDYCRRAVSKGLEIARSSGGSLGVLTLGPPSADTVCREAIAFGADVGYHVSDPAFAGSDTLATAKALAAAVRLLGPFDLILCGRNSVDADTGQVPPQLAQLLDLPFACGVRELSLEGERLRMRLEHDDEWVDAETHLPALLSCAERLCDPCKIKSPDIWATVDGSLIRRIGASELGDGPWGAAASPTWVGKIRSVDVERRREMLTGSLAEQVERALEVLSERGALAGGDCDAPRPLGAARGSRSDAAAAGANAVPTRHTSGSRGEAAAPPAGGSAAPKGEGGSSPTVAVIVEPRRQRGTRQLLGAAASLAAEIKGSVTALGETSALEGGDLGRWGADHLLFIASTTAREGAPQTQTVPEPPASSSDARPAAGQPPGPDARPAAGQHLEPDPRLAEADIARAALRWARASKPWAILTLGTAWGREVASRLAAELGAGLTGDAVGLQCVDGRLIADKPAFGGHLIAAIGCTSPVQMATVREGVFPLPEPRVAGEPHVAELRVSPSGRLRVTSRSRDDDSSSLANAEVVIGVGKGVDVADYEFLNAAARRIGAELCATRKVTDVASMPRARQVGITGHTIAPRLYIAAGISGRFNHTVGVRSSGSIVAVNTDPAAQIFDWCDVGFVGDWREVFDALVPRLEAALRG